MGTGGGKQPKSTTQITELPAWARGYAKDILAKGAALTDINTNPYVTYGGERLAGFDPMQQQSFEDARNMGVAPQIGQATQMATQAGQYNPADFQNQYNNQLQQYTGANVNQYMNPYLEGALAPQLREAASAGMQAQNMNAAKAVGMGAFGGTRGALQQSMTEKNVMQNMADINARGYSDAFNQAAGMFSADQQRRMQDAQLRAQYGLSADQAREQSRQFGAGQGLNAAQLLGQLGGQQFQQGMDINKLRNTYGAQQQAREQRKFDNAYQDFLDEQNYAYKQLGFMSDLIKNPAIGSRSQTQMYEPAPNMLSTVAGLGVGAAALAKAKGGIVGYAGGGIAGYADGGMPGDVTSPENISEILSKLSDEQLQQVLQMRPELTQEIQMEMARRQDVRGAQVTPPMEQGLAALPTGPMPQMADGGIVAFAGGDAVKEEPLTVGELLARNIRGVGADAVEGINVMGSDISEGVRRILGATKSGISSILPSRQQYGAREAAWLARQPQFSEEALRNYPIPKGGPRGSAGSPMSDEVIEAARAAQAEQPAAADERAAPAPRASGLGAAASALKLPDFGKPQSVSDIEKEMEPFLARRRAENAELLKPEQAAVDALHASIAESKKGDVKQQLLGIAAGLLGGSPHFAANAGKALENYMNISKEQKKFNADAVKEATAAQTALARYKVALDKGDEATAAKYKEIADSKADRAIGHQLQVIQLGIAAKQADTQAAHYANIGYDSRKRLNILKNAAAQDIKVGQEYTKVQKQVDDMLAKDNNYMLASPEEKEVMRRNALIEKTREHPMLGKISGGIGFSSGETGNIREGSL
jgi:hypothetical protein